MTHGIIRFFKFSKIKILFFISNLQYKKKDEKTFTLLLTDAKCFPGMEGGGVFDKNNNLIGMLLPSLSYLKKNFFFNIYFFSLFIIIEMIIILLNIILLLELVSTFFYLKIIFIIDCILSYFENVIPYHMKVIKTMM